MIPGPEPGDSGGSGGRLIVGRYRIRRLLGRGGMGAVWAAHDEILGREVAIKEVLPSPGLTPEQQDLIRRRTMREARAAARLDHPSAVTVYDVVEDEGRPWIVMQLLAPRTLGDVLADGHTLTVVAAAGIGLDLLAALQAAHRVGVLHRDVKPANVLLSETGRAVLTDFGIATLEDDPTLTSTGMLVGSPGYMSPERARGERPTPASDLWSLGATLYAAVEGDSPFRRDSQLLTLNAVLTQPAPPARHAGPLRPVIASLLARDPADRPSSTQLHTMLTHIRNSADAEPTTERAAWTTEITPVDVDPTFIAWRDAATVTTSRSADPDVSRPQADSVAATVLPSPAPTAHPTLDAPAPATLPALRPMSPSTPEPPVRPRPRRSRRPFVFATVAAGILVLAAALWVTRLSHTPSSPTTTGARVAAHASSPAASTTGNGSAGATPAAAATRGSAGSERPHATVAASASSHTTATSSGTPSGFQSHHDPSGFSVAVPTGWIRSTKGSSVYFREPNGRSYLQIDQTTHPKANALRDWQNQEASAARRFPGYHRIRLQKVTYRGWDAADWEFTWQPPNGTLHVLNRNIRVSDTRAYALYWSVPAQQWKQRQTDFTTVADTFEPAS